VEPRQILTRCEVRSRDGTRGLRFVPLAELGLWQQVMSARHGIQVLSAAVGLWLADDELDRNEPWLARAGAPEAVDRLDLTLFDGDLGLCHLVRRYTASDGVLELRDRLLQHLDAHTNPANIHQEITGGHFMLTHQMSNLRRLTNPLAAADADIAA
jgi:hypothetical protein